MKFENFEQVKKIVDKIGKYQQDLDAVKLHGDVLITIPSGRHIFEIAVDGDSEYTPQAKRLIEEIEINLQTSINNYKSLLETL